MQWIINLTYVVLKMKNLIIVLFIGFTFTNIYINQLLVKIQLSTSEKK